MVYSFIMHHISLYQKEILELFKELDISLFTCM